jgi:Domain of unknown function (DUF4105)
MGLSPASLRLEMHSSRHQNRHCNDFEHDIVRLRTNYRLEDVYLYHLIPATPERARALFLDYVKSANEFHERAQWYNELLSNCTSNIRLHIKHIGSARPWDWQLLVNGSIEVKNASRGLIAPARQVVKSGVVCRLRSQAIHDFKCSKRCT